MAEKVFTEEQVKEATSEYYAGDQLATNVFVKYALRKQPGVFVEKTPDDMHVRMAKEFERIESKFPNSLRYGSIYDQLYRFRKIVPQGSPMFGIGNPYQIVSLSNCVVIDPPKDTVSDIMEVGKSMANLFKRRCGVGTDLSTLRPEGAVVNNSAGTSTGAWSFANYFSEVCRMIGQYGRRGALMLTMPVEHPDIYQFVTMKEDKTKVTGANVSVRLSNEFMQAVRDDTEFTLRWPVDAEEPKYTKVIQAKHLWETIVKQARDNAEPGLLFWDAVKEYMPADCYPEFVTISTNPCVTKDTWVMTSVGARQVSDLLLKPFNAIVNGEAYFSEGFFKTGHKKVIKLTTEHGHELKVTRDHKIKTNQGWVEAGQLTPSNEILVGNNGGLTWGGEGSFEEGWCVGSIVGDGCYNPKKYPTQMCFWGEDRKYMSSIALKFLNENLSHLLTRGEVSGKESEAQDKSIVASRALGRLCERYIKIASKEAKPELEKSSWDFYRGFLRGLFDADGSYQGNLKKGVSIRLSQTSLERLKMVQRMLSRMGIVSKIYPNREKGGYRTLPNGKGGSDEYLCKENHELVISKEMIDSYMEIIGFFEPSKNKRHEEILLERKRQPYKTAFYTKLLSVEDLPSEDVYDCTVEEIHEFEANGIIVHNCSEIPLSANDSCRLTSINLKHFVVNPFRKRGDDKACNSWLDYTDLEQTVRKTVRLLDDLIELEIESLDKIIEARDEESEKKLFGKLKSACERGRRIGLGTHGLADMLARMQYKYDTDEAINFVEDLYEKIKIWAYDESANLAKTRGAFPAFDWELEKNCKFFKSFPDWLLEKIKVNGRRHVSILTCAPTGSVSILSQTSSGIEPVFANFMIRRRKIDHTVEKIVPDYVDKMGDAWIEFEVLHQNVKEYIDMFGGTLDDLPEYFVTAPEIQWEQRVKMQAAMQRHIDHAISSTINLPQDVTEERVGNIYFSAWENGLKGITVYREGSRSGVLLTSKQENEKYFLPTDAPKRPETLPIEVHVMPRKQVALVGIMDGSPYELMVVDEDVLKDYDLAQEVELIKYKVYKTRETRYDLLVGDQRIKEIQRDFILPDVTRLVSLSLRHGAKPSFIVEQLGKTSKDFFSDHKNIARVLKTYIEDGEEVSGDKVCSECNEPGLVYMEGCETCMNCGHAKCG